MGKFEKENDSESQTRDTKLTPQLLAAIMLVIGLAAPVLLSIYYDGLSLIILQGAIWMYSSSSYGNSLSTVSLDFAIIPLLLLRIVPAYQIFRYYNGKTTKNRAYIASIVGDGLFLSGGIVILLFSMAFQSMLSIPLPFQMIFGFYILWKLPGPEPTSPWKDNIESRTWWAKRTDTERENPNDD
ncbi:MAG: hypothetical protein KAR03_00495 [Candidatus Thorarchaeota archaeon]|nr:hypothetical protein [Candidatus Thorarchaeota archaeon]